MTDEQIIFSLPFSSYPNDSYEDMVRRARALCSQGNSTPSATIQAPLSSKQSQPTYRPSNSAMEGKLKGILHTYNVEAVSTPQEIRNFVIGNMILLSIEAKNEATKTKCLEMLGKVKDVALFEERTVVFHENMSTEQLQAELRKYVTRLRGEVTTIPEKEIKDVS